MSYLTLGDLGKKTKVQKLLKLTQATYATGATAAPSVKKLKKIERLTSKLSTAQQEKFERKVSTPITTAALQTWARTELHEQDKLGPTEKRAAVKAWNEYASAVRSAILGLIRKTTAPSEFTSIPRPGYPVPNNLRKKVEKLDRQLQEVLTVYGRANLEPPTIIDETEEDIPGRFDTGTARAFEDIANMNTGYSPGGEVGLPGDGFFDYAGGGGGGSGGSTSDWITEGIIPTDGDVQFDPVTGEPIDPEAEVQTAGFGGMSTKTLLLAGAAAVGLWFATRKSKGRSRGGGGGGYSSLVR